MKKFFPKFLAFIIIALVVFPLFIHADTADKNSLIVCLGTSDDPCTFDSFILLVNNVIKTLIIYSTLITTGILAYAGFKLITSGGDVKAKEDAKKMLIKVVWGYVWILIAWLVVYTITSALLNTDKGYSTLLGQPK